MCDVMDVYLKPTVGVCTPDGSMMLVDRLKNLIKLKGGEYIALESMEASYSTSPYCAALLGGVMVYGDGEMDPRCVGRLGETSQCTILRDCEPFV